MTEIPRGEQEKSLPDELRDVENKEINIEHRQSPQEMAERSGAASALAAYDRGERPYETKHRQPRSLDERFKNDTSDWTTWSIDGGRFPLSKLDAENPNLRDILEARSQQWTHSSQYCQCPDCMVASANNPREKRHE
jgi:hypothetical protein